MDLRRGDFRFEAQYERLPLGTESVRTGMGSAGLLTFEQGGERGGRSGLVACLVPGGRKSPLIKGRGRERKEQDR